MPNWAILKYRNHLLWPDLDLGIVDLWILLAGDDAEGCWVFWDQLWPQDSPRRTHISHFIRISQQPGEPLELTDANENLFEVVTLTADDQKIWDEYQKLKVDFMPILRRLSGSFDGVPPGMVDINPEFASLFSPA